MKKIEFLFIFREGNYHKIKNDSFYIIVEIKQFLFKRNKSIRIKAVDNNRFEISELFPKDVVILITRKLPDESI
jgi:hypothetical protein